MGKYDYLQAVIDDVKQYIVDNEITVTTDNRDEIEQQLNEDLFTEDSVTGNASGSYTFSTNQAEENLCHNMDLLADALSEFGYTFDYLKKGAEACDVTIRCYLLNQAISDVLDEIEVDDDDDE